MQINHLATCLSYGMKHLFTLFIFTGPLTIIWPLYNKEFVLRPKTKQNKNCSPITGKPYFSPPVFRPERGKRKIIPLRSKENTYTISSPAERERSSDWSRVRTSSARSWAPNFATVTHHKQQRTHEDT